MKFFKGSRTQVRSTEIPVLKALLLGDVGSDKSAIANMIRGDGFANQATIGMDFAIRQFDLEDQSIKLQLWDTVGQERFRRITQAYYNDTKIAIVVANSGNTDSIETWLKDIDTNAKTPISKFVLLTTTSEDDFTDDKVQAMTEAFNPPHSTGKPVHVLLVNSDSKDDILAAFTKMLKTHLKAEAKPEDASAAASAPVLS